MIGGIPMKKKLTLLCLAMLAASSPVSASPAVSFEKGMIQADLSGWNTEGKYSNLNASYDNMPVAYVSNDFFSYPSYQSMKFNDESWSLSGGITYGLSEKWAVQYQYAKMSADTGSVYIPAFNPPNLPGKEQLTGYSHELNALYSISNYAAVYGGIKRIHTSLKIKNSLDFSSEGGPNLNGTYLGKTNNILHIGLIGKYPLSENADVYGKIGFGAKNTAEAELGLGYRLNPNLDMNIGYRYLKTQGNNGAAMVSFGDGYSGAIIDPAVGNSRDVTFRGFTLGLSYRFNR